MAKVLIIGGRNVSIAASTTQYDAVLDCSRAVVGTEANAQVTMRAAGVFSNLFCNISTNNRNTSTLRFRLNGANGNQVVTITGSTTGQFEDTTNSDTVAAGDEVATSIVTGSTGSTFTMLVYSLVFAASSGTVKKMGVFVGLAVSTASTSFYCALGGFRESTTEAPVQLKLKTAGTFANLFVSVVTNARSTSTVLRFRKNGANGNQVITVTAGSTGLFEDLSGADSVAVDDLVNTVITTGTGTGNFLVHLLASELSSSSSQFHLVASAGGGNVLNAAATNYYAAGGRFEAAITTETNFLADAQFPLTLSKLACYVSSNTVVASSTMRLRVNGADVNQVATLTGLTTGLFEDTTNSDVLTATAEISLQGIGGGGGTSLTFNLTSMLATVPSSFVPYPFSRGARGGVGATSGGLQ